MTLYSTLSPKSDSLSVHQVSVISESLTSHEWPVEWRVTNLFWVTIKSKTTTLVNVPMIHLSKTHVFGGDCGKRGCSTTFPHKLSVSFYTELKKGHVVHEPIFYLKTLYCYQKPQYMVKSARLMYLRVSDNRDRSSETLHTHLPWCPLRTCHCHWDPQSYRSWLVNLHDHLHCQSLPTMNQLLISQPSYESIIDKTLDW